MPTSTRSSKKYSHSLLLIELQRERNRRLALKEGRLTQSTWVYDSQTGAFVQGVYVNRDTLKYYRPHSDAERVFVQEDAPRYMLAKGGEGGGKSVAGIVKTLEKLRRGMSGIMGSPDLPHFKRSLWQEFRRWCPVEAVVPSQRYRLAASWYPTEPFQLVFTNGATLLCGGFDDPSSWEGPNVNFAFFDEARRHKTPAMLKVLDGRCRISGPNGEPPQIYIATTPSRHWLFDYFGPPLDDDPYVEFKEACFVIDLPTAANIENLSPTFIEDRARSLTESERRVLLDGLWEDLAPENPFLPSMSLWDRCYDPSLGPPSPHEPLIIAADAATGRKNRQSDCFALVVLSAYDGDEGVVAIRECAYWRAPRGGQIDFLGTPEHPGPERVIRDWCDRYTVIQFTYDPMQLVDMSQRLARDGVWCKPFTQQTQRTVADNLLLEMIVNRRLRHTGDLELRKHVANCDRRMDPTDRKVRIVKSNRGPIDLAVAVSMGVYRALELHL